MTFDLAAARALHDRDPENPYACRTCRDSYAQPASWPCPTATALGATGRSEWVGPTHNTIAEQLCAIVDANVWDAGTLITTPMCAHDHVSGRRCQRPADHDGLHRELDPVRWDDQGTIRCLTTRPDGEECSKVHAHDGPHDYGRTDAAECPSLSPGGKQCEADPGHDGLHYHGPLYRWHPSPCRHTSTDQNGQPTSCVLADAHHGVCYFRSARHDTPHCQPADPGSMTCALRAGHFGAHVTYNGLDFKDIDRDPA